MYSIDPKVKTLYMNQTIDKYLFDSFRDKESIIRESKERVLFATMQEAMATGANDFVVSVQDPVPSGFNSVAIRGFVIPGEYMRLIERIDRLENELNAYKWSRNFDTSIAEMLGKANKKVDDEGTD